MKQKGFTLLIVIIFIVVIIGAIGYLGYKNNRNLIRVEEKGELVASPSDLESKIIWKTYIDQGNKFSISYPDDWSINVSPEGGTPFSLSSKKYPSSLPQGDNKIFFFSENNDKGLNLLDWVKKYGHNQGKLPTSVYSHSSINSIPTVEINYTWTKEFANWLNSNYPTGVTEGPPPLGTKFREINLKKDNKIIQIQITSLDNKDNTNFFNEVDQILSTLKFTN